MSRSTTLANMGISSRLRASHLLATGSQPSVPQGCSLQYTWGRRKARPWVAASDAWGCSAGLQDGAFEAVRVALVREGCHARHQRVLLRRARRGEPTEQVVEQPRKRADLYLHAHI